MILKLLQPLLKWEPRVLIDIAWEVRTVLYSALYPITASFTHVYSILVYWVIEPLMQRNFPELIYPLFCLRPPYSFCFYEQHDLVEPISWHFPIRGIVLYGVVAESSQIFHSVNVCSHINIKYHWRKSWLFLLDV